MMNNPTQGCTWCSPFQGVKPSIPDCTETTHLPDHSGGIMRTIFYCITATLALLLVLTDPVSAQVVSGKVIVVAVPDRFKAGNGNEPTHGIANVGIGARVVLKPFVVSGV